MKSASPALLALLASRQFYSADLYQFTLAGGTQLYYCSGDQDIVWNAITWSAGKSVGPYFDRKDNKAKCRWKIGVEVDSLAFDVLPGSATVAGAPFLSAVRQGLFDGAELTLFRAFMPSYGNTAAGTVLMFSGRVAEIDAGRSLATVTVNSHLELLNIMMPRNLYQAGCVNTLFDAGCTLNAAAFATGGVAQAGSTSHQVLTLLPNATGYFNLGHITFTSGVNAGFSRTVQSHANNGVNNPVAVYPPLPSAPAAGDSFVIYPGCDKSQATCAAKFSNSIHFRGFPNTPQPSTAV